MNLQTMPRLPEGRGLGALMNAKVISLVATGLFASLLSRGSTAKPYVESIGRVKIDWATHKIHFYGESKLPEATKPDATYRGIEKAAWQDGLNYVAKTMSDYHAASFASQVTDPAKLAADAKQAAVSLTKTTTSRKTIYYSDGTVRVVLENPLPKALSSPTLRFRQKEAMTPSAARYSGVVFQLDRPTKARPIYQVVDETGVVLFDEKDMAEQSYQKHLMGYWYISPTDAELKPAVGDSPLKVAAKVDSNGRFIVSKAAWLDALSGYKPLLVSGRIAISLPEPQ